MSEEKQQQEEAALTAEESDAGDLEMDLDGPARLDDQELAESLAEDQSIEDEFVSSSSVSASSVDEDSSLSEDDELTEEDEIEAGGRERIRIIASDETVAEAADELFSRPAGDPAPESLNGTSGETSSEDQDEIRATRDELKPVIESLLFVADEPLPFKQLCKVLGDVPEEDVKLALEELIADYESRGSGLEVREIAGGWRISTRPQHHEFIRKYLKSRPSARLSLPALETLAVIAYKQPITIPEILEIRGVSSSSAIKTLLEKRLIVTKGRKETVGRPMMYGTSKEFMIQFGLRDLTELPSIEDFEDFSQ
jgi:segregation and condensation protein B